MCDKDSGMHAGFFLMRRVTDQDFERKRQHVRSGSTTPTEEVCLVCLMCLELVSICQELQFWDSREAESATS